MRRAGPAKKQRERFMAQAKALLLQMTATQDGEDFVLRTKAGRLVLHPVEHRDSGLGTVFGRFDDPKAARQIVECNQFSGKWNHHYFDGWTVETAIDDLTAELRIVLA